MQDLLDLPATAMLNRPGTTIGNRQWRFASAELEQLVRTKRGSVRGVQQKGGSW